MTLHPTVGSVAQNLATTSHPRALNQHTTTRESFVSQHHSPKRMDGGIMESWNAGMPLIFLIIYYVEQTLEGEPHAHTSCVHM